MLNPAEGNIGNNLGDQYFADQCTVRIVAMHALTGAGPDATVRIQTDPVIQARSSVAKYLTARDTAPICVDFVTTNMARAIHDVCPASIGDIKIFLVG